MDKYKLCKTEHDYAGCVGADSYDSYKSWQDWKKQLLPFGATEWDWYDTFNFVIRYDIFEKIMLMGWTYTFFHNVLEIQVKLKSSI